MSGAIFLTTALLAGVFCLGCGGATTAVDAVDAGQADVGRNPAEDVGTVLGVPSGDTYVGNWIFDAAARKFLRPSVCGFTPQLKELGNKRLSVPAFLLQETPVTNLLYSICVARGACTPPDHDIADPNSLAWDDPARADLPVYARYEQAEAYCRWARGRLPSMAELIRAAQGDVAQPGVKALTQAAIDCFGPGATGDTGTQPICGQIKLMDFQSGSYPPLSRVRGLDLDQGPFGHFDVFGSVYEWTRSYINGIPGEQFCALADGSKDFVTFPQEAGYPRTHLIVKFAIPMLRALEGVNFASGFRAAQDYMNRYYIGFRCAFDEAPR
jgi:formylglycine-generating enzyme required for sulfatase activity